MYNEATNPKSSEWAREDGEPSSEEINDLLTSRPLRTKSTSKHFIHITALYSTNIILLLCLMITWDTRFTLLRDPSRAIYSPANDAVEYVNAVHFRAALFNNTAYMGYPSADGKTDQLWSDLYNFGISKITKEQASRLHTPTLAIPGTEDYLIELDVWHQLHCLNDLRMVLYPEVYGGLQEVTWPNGTINRDTDAFRHWDHCIDSLRQAIMCHADVSPIPFHVNVPVNKGIFPRLATTHTCRNFERIQEWAKEHWAGEWDFRLNPEKAESVIAESGFDNSPEEDIEFLWPDFPGNKFFEHWRQNSVSKF